MLDDEEVLDQMDTRILGGKLTEANAALDKATQRAISHRGRAFHLTGYSRRGYWRGRRLGKWLPWLLLAAGAIIWLIVSVIPW